MFMNIKISLIIETNSVRKLKIWLTFEIEFCENNKYADSPFWMVGWCSLAFLCRLNAEEIQKSFLSLEKFDHKLKT
jgi:hypothetical protein